MNTSNLLEVLAELYIDVADAKRLVDDAGLDKTLIDFEGCSRQRWAFILKQAIVRNKDKDLIAVVLDEYSINEPLIHAWSHYSNDNGKVEFIEFLDQVINEYTRKPSHHTRYAASLPVSPDVMVQRPRIFSELQRLLSGQQPSSRGEHQLVRLIGGPGSGKTTLAWDFYNKTIKKEIYANRIFWITIGPHAEQLDDGLEEIFTQLGGGTAQLHRSQDLISLIGKLPSIEDSLVILDDVWEEDAISHLLELWPVSFLITTRNVNIMRRSTSATIDVDKMLPEESIQMLCSQVKHGENAVTDQDPEYAKLQALAERLSHWPLLLQIWGSQLHRELESGVSLLGAITWVNKGLDKQGVFAFDSANTADRNHAMQVSLDFSWKRCTACEQQRLLELLIFRDGELIPENVVAKLWSTTAEEGEFAAEKLIRDLAGCFYRRSTQEKTKQQVIDMHGFIREYLVSQQKQTCMKSVHDALLRAYNNDNAPWHTVKNDGYLYNHLVYHLEEAGRFEEMFALFTTPDWANTRDRFGLLNDFYHAQLCTNTKPQINIQWPIRFALFNAVIQALYSSLPITALAASADTGLTTSNMLPSAIRSMNGSPMEKVHAYFNFLERIPQTAHHRFVSEIYTIAKQIEDPQERVTAIKRILPMLPESSHPEAHRIQWLASFAIEDAAICCAIVKELNQKLTIPLRQQLLQDALRIEKIYRKVRVLKEILPSFSLPYQEQVWIAVYEEAKELFYNQYSLLEFLAVLVPLLPRHLQTRTGADFWLLLDSIPNWDVIYDSFEVLLPFIPAEQLPAVWSRVETEISQLDEYWGMHYLIATARYLPDELLQDLQELVATLGSHSRYRAACEIEIASRLFKSDEPAQMALYLQAGQRAISGYGEHFSVQMIISRLPAEIIAELWPYALNELKNGKQHPHEDSESYHFRMRDGIVAIAHGLPSSQILSACKDLISNHQRVNEGIWIDVMGVLLNRAQHTDIDAVWQATFDNMLLATSDNYLSFACVYNLIDKVPQLQHERYFNAINDRVEQISDIEHRASMLLSTLHLYSQPKQVELWNKAWLLVMESSEGNDLQWARGRLMATLPSIFQQMRSSHSINFSKVGEVLIDVDWMYHIDAKGLSLLVVSGSQQFARKIWNQFGPENNEHRIHSIELVWLALFPHLDADQQQYILPKIFRMGYTSNRLSVLRKLNLLHYLPDEARWSIWTTLCADLDGKNDHIYTPWAELLSEYIPQDKMYLAWRLALDKIAPIWWPEWPEICEEIAKRLPPDAIERAWNDVERAEQELNRFRYAVQLKAALASQLPHELQKKIIVAKALQLEWPDDIFTCSPDKYLRYGGIWIHKFGGSWASENPVRSLNKWQTILVGGLQYLWGYCFYIFGPLMWLLIKIFAPIARYSYVLPKQNSFLRFLRPLQWCIPWLPLFLLHLFNMALRGIWLLFYIVYSLLSGYGQISAHYTLSKNEATEKVLNSAYSNCSMEEMMSLRPLIQRAGGSALRNDVADAYRDAQSWWKERLIQTD